MTVSAFEGGCLRAPLTAVTTNAAGGVLSLANPEGVDIIVTRIILNITAPSTGAATVDAGIAANGATSSDTLIDGASVATAAKLLDNLTDGGTNGKSRQKWGASQFLTITASATLAGMTGEALIEFLPA